MNAQYWKKTIQILAVIISIFFLTTRPAQAAFPIHYVETINNEKTNVKNEFPDKTKLTQVENKYIDEQKKVKKEDEGVYGILAFAFGFIGFFPVAIVLGIIGLQRHRKYKGLATAGLILGLLPLIILLIFFGFFIAVI